MNRLDVKIVIEDQGQSFMVFNIVFCRSQHFLQSLQMDMWQDCDKVAFNVCHRHPDHSPEAE
jgi:hypothetical protein